MKITFLIYITLPLLFGWLLDRILGDPEWLPHPIVAFGKAIYRAEQVLNKGKNKILKGAFVALFFPLTVFIVALTINVIMYFYYFKIGIIVNTIFVFFTLAGKTLIKEVRNVFEAVEISLEKGRKQVARIVGRDTSQLNEQQIKTAALETLSENLSDGVIAPLFWYAVCRVPAILTYKMINTLDSMIGYKSDRYKDFGRWSAKIDDIANFIPARITAFLMLLVSRKLSLLTFVKKYRKQHTSPNAGYPESALAGILNCRFGGGNYYFGKFVEKPYIGENKKKLTTQDLKKAIQINRRTEIVMLIILFMIYSGIYLVK